MVALVTSMSTKLLPLTPVTGSLNRTVTLAVLGTAVPIGARATMVGPARSAVTPQRASTTEFTPLVGATCELAPTVAVSRSR